MNYREKMREYLKEPNQLSSQYGKWGILNREQRQMITRLLDEMDRADIYIKELFFKNEAYENMRKEMLEIINYYGITEEENDDWFVRYIFKEFLNILNKVGGSDDTN